MKTEMSIRDIRLLQIAFSLLAAVLMIRLAIVPAIEKYQERELALTEVQAQAEEIQRIIDDKPVSEKRIETGLKRLEEAAKPYYEQMENREIDRLVTGIALAHELFPAHLSMENTEGGAPEAYLYSSLAETEAAAEAEEAAQEAESPDGETAAGTEAAAGIGETEEALRAQSVIQRVEASITVTGNEENVKAFLDDIENNYPAIHVKSFEISRNIYMNASMEAVEETEGRFTLDIYMYSIPEADREE